MWKIIFVVVALLVYGAIGCNPEDERGDRNSVIGEAFSEEVVVREPGPDEFDAIHGGSRMEEVLAGRALVELRDIVGWRIGEKGVSEETFEGLRERHITHLARMSGTTEEELSEWRANEIRKLEKLIEFYSEQGDVPPPSFDEVRRSEQGGLVGYRFLLPDKGAARAELNRVTAAKTDAEAFFGPSADLRSRIVATLMVIEGEEALNVSDEAVGEAVDRRAQQGFHDDPRDVELLIIADRAQRVVDKYIIDKIESGDITIVDRNVRRSLLEMLEEVMELGNGE